jgi:hypothetical protein
VLPKTDKRNWRDLVVENAGRRLAGSYAVRRGIVYVRLGERDKAAQIGGLPPESLARMMIVEIANEKKRGG